MVIADGMLVERLTLSWPTPDTNAAASSFVSLLSYPVIAVSGAAAVSFFGAMLIFCWWSSGMETELGDEEELRSSEKFERRLRMNMSSRTRNLTACLLIGSEGEYGSLSQMRT